MIRPHRQQAMPLLDWPGAPEYPTARETREWAACLAMFVVVGVLWRVFSP